MINLKLADKVICILQRSDFVQLEVVEENLYDWYSCESDS